MTFALRSRVFGPLSLALLVAGAPRLAHAQTTDATIAEALFREAQALMQAGKISEACKKFAASEAAQPAIGTRLNLAVCHEREGKTASAWAGFTAVRAEAVLQKDERRKAYAEARLAVLEGKLRKLTLHVPAPVPGIAITLDGHPIASEAWNTELPVDPGEHVIAASAPGHRTWTVKITFAPGPGTDRVEVPPLEKSSPKGSETTPGSEHPPSVTSAAPVAPVAAKPLAPASEPAAPTDSRRTIGLVVGGAGLVSVGVGIVALLTARSHADDRDAICAPGTRCKTDEDFRRAEDAHDSARTAQLVGFITGGIGVAALGVGTWLFLSAEPTRERAALRVAPAIGPGHAGFSLTRSF